ncbi:MAG: PQQ-dependent sugar dehydrogenase, partial [Phycisphaerales bacterium]|nr:PQQ-dependent sugar dehydrogenase [Phycisphaerales bacterium]
MRHGIGLRTLAGLAVAALTSVTSTLFAGGTPLTTELVANGLARPDFVTHAPGDFDRIFIVEQRSGSTGRIRIVDLATDTLLATPFLSISGVNTSSEQGLLGLAFHPDYDNNGYFYVYYTSNALGSNRTHVVRYSVSANPNIADASSAQTVLLISQPFTNHNGGWMGFGPNDGYLYIGTGDGGDACDPGQRAQDITNQLLGKMLRIDVDGDDFPADPDKNYAIPASNPFVGITGDDEIWAYGLRNPWRCDFDDETGDLYIADVGQNAREEIDFQPASSTGGENYGWDCREGTGCAVSISFQCSGTSVGCSCTGVSSVDPIQEYTHGSGCSISGGVVYRGCKIPDLAGTYFYADHCSNTIWSFRGPAVADFEVRTAELDPPGALSITGISSFGEDAYGEVYICDLFGGEVFRIVANNGAGFAGDDCDMNGIADSCEILDGSSADANSNGIPDVCESAPCPWDCTPPGGNGIVNIDD